MSRVVTFGEIMLRLGPPGYQRLAQATALEMYFGGAEANVAVMIARLGGEAEFVTKLPRNDVADRCLAELHGQGVGTGAVARGGQRIGIYFVENGAGQRGGQVIYDRANSAIAEAAPGDFDWTRIFEGAGWFHWSGITPALSASAAALTAEACQAARRLGLTVSFDMNYRSKLWSREKAGAVLSPLMPGVDLCVCGGEDARNIFGMTGESDAALADAMRDKFGFKTIAMTQREGESASQTTWGATLFTEAGSFSSPRHEITVVDRVGAGDSYTGALIFALSRGDPPQKANDFAVAACALKHTIPGDFALLSLPEVEALATGAAGGRIQR